MRSLASQIVNIEISHVSDADPQSSTGRTTIRSLIRIERIQSRRESIQTMLSETCAPFYTSKFLSFYVLHCAEGSSGVNP